MFAKWKGEVVRVVHWAVSSSFSVESQLIMMLLVTFNIYIIIFHFTGTLSVMNVLKSSVRLTQFLHITDL